MNTNLKAKRIPCFGERIEFKNSKGQKIVGVLEKANDKGEIAIFIHGFSANKDGGPKFMAEELAKNKINSFRIDLDNQGESEPKLEEASITNYKDTVLSAIRKLQELGFQAIDLVGTSFGGAVALAVANRFPINKMVLRAPVLDHYQRMLKQYGKEKIEEFKKAGHVNYYKDGQVYKIGYQWVEDGKLYPFEKMKDITCPILIIHGTNDDTVDYKDSVEKVSQFPNARLVSIKGASHFLGVNGDWTESSQALVGFLKK